MWELGVFAGVMFPHPRLELFEFDQSLPDGGFKRHRGVAPDIGLRVAYMPLRVFGLEAEGAVMPSQLASGDAATLWAIRGHALAQLPFWSVTPFVVAGVSGLGVASDRSAVGNDVDMGFHFGAGVKVFISRYTAVRLDVRDNLSARRGVGDGVIHSPEVLLGFSFTLGRKKSEGPGDRDGDGILDPDDKCPDTPGVPEYDGCPIPDSDGDGILDPDDKCPDTPGVPEYDGCPVPDTDGDGIPDDRDGCPETPGVEEYAGCPIPDSDGDGILDPDDKCPQEPETSNNYQDADGCPDEVPKEVEKFSGVIEGIYFDTNKATIQPKSKPRLDNAVETLKKYPDLKLEISGHTDDRGDDAHNMDLSRRRAEAVRDYLVTAGIDASRLKTRGAGESEPIDTNDTSKGRAKNRRIEFKRVK
jgi:OOP family OmpA-OmpF porin